MSPPSDRRAEGARIAVIGATTPDGSRLRERLASFGVPGSRVDLYGGTRGEALISDYAGEARMIQDPEPGEAGDHDVIFLCVVGAAAEQAAAGASPGAVVIDVVGSLTGEERPPLVHMDINPERAKERRDRLAVPHPVALLLAELLEPLERRFGLEEAVALVLRPAARLQHHSADDVRRS